jgi:hypothetical protein
MNQLQEIAHIVSALVGEEYLYFDTELQVIKSPHDDRPLFMWAVCAKGKAAVYLMDSSQTWHQVEERHHLVMASLYQRVKLLEKRYSKHLKTA